MKLTNDVHLQLAEFFPSKLLQPYIYILSKKLSDGHICININEIDEKILHQIPYENIAKKEEVAKDAFVSHGEIKTPFILLHDQLYFERYFNYETIILNRIREFIEEETADRDKIIATLESQKDFIKDLFINKNQGNSDKQSINWQLVAAVCAVINHFTIITGGPGTGKTTTVAKIISILFRVSPELKIALCAPTGKAAARMGDSLQQAANFAGQELKEKLSGLVPSTIHRLLGNINNSPYFVHNQDNTLNFDLIIADESSMIDVALFAKLLSAIGPKTKLILLGDKDQLASVEAGSLFGDLCGALENANRFSSERATLINRFMEEPAAGLTTEYIEDKPCHHLLFEHIVELSHSHRFSDNRGIGKFSKAIINNQMEIIAAFMQNTDDQVQIDNEYDINVFESFIKGYEDYILEPDTLAALRKFHQLKILCAIREGPEGIHALNRRVEQYLQKRHLIALTGQYYIHRPLMVTSNNTELQLYNGDVGIIRPDKNGELKAWFESSSQKGELRAVTPGFINQPETVYAMTIHKSQGSEFNKVLVVLPKQEVQLLTRELLYTAVTRARQNVIIQGAETSILKAAHAYIQRGSGIARRMM